MLWANNTVRCIKAGAMFTLWVKPLCLSTEWLSCWTLSKYRKRYGDGLEQQEVVQTKQVIHEHRWVPARPDVERLRKCLDWGGVHVLVQANKEYESEELFIRKTNNGSQEECKCSGLSSEIIGLLEVCYIRFKEKHHQIKFCYFFNKLYFSGWQWDEQEIYELTKRRLTNLMMLPSLIR